MVGWVQQRLPSLRAEPIAFAHRGARAYARENTLESFQLAAKLGANGVETDAWLTADGHVVLDHDGVVPSRLRRPRPISEVALKNLPQHIPSLDAFFEACGTNLHVSIDVKDDNTLKPIIDSAKNARMPLDKLWLCHHRIEFTLEARKQFSDVRIVDSSRLKRIKEGLEMRCALLAQHGVDVLNMHISDWNGGLVTTAHKFGLHAFGWDVQFSHALHDAVRMGLDGVYSDYTDRLVDAYSQELGFAPRI